MAFLRRDSENGEDGSLFFFHNAAENGNDAAIHAVLQAHDSKVSAQDITSPRSPQAVEALISYSKNALLNRRDDDQYTPLHLALLQGHWPCVQLLLQHGADAHALCEDSTMLHIAASMAALPAYRDLGLHATELGIKHGVSTYIKDDHGRTALHWAAIADHDSLCELLAQQGKAERRARLAEAAERAAPKLASAPDAQLPELMEPQPAAAVAAPPNLLLVPDDRGNTALHLAARYAARRSLAVLVAAAADISVEDADEAGTAVDASAGLDTPSHKSGSTLALTLRNKSGQTPLHCAGLGGCAHCTHVLLAACAEAAAERDRSGRTPVELASQRGASQVVKALVEAAACEPPGDAHAAGPSFDAAQGAAADTPMDELQAPGTQDPGAQQSPRCLIVTSPACLAHHTSTMPFVRGETDLPPENFLRLEAITHPQRGCLRTNLFQDSCVWADDCQPAAMTDVLRVHEWSYIKRVRDACASVAGEPGHLAQLDSDTSISAFSFRAALTAAGSVCHAIDSIMEGQTKRAFCAVRPPGHHAGPHGAVPNATEKVGSHGFCLLNNIAIGAAYAMSTYRHRGIRRVALLDFDVHHGNGTESCVANTAPTTSVHTFTTPYSSGSQMFHTWRPWFDGNDRKNILFASVQGFGKRARFGPHIYPGSGATCDTSHVPMDVDHPPEDVRDTVVPDREPSAVGGVPEDPDNEFMHSGGELPRTDGPRIINVGIPGPGVKANLWRRAWRDKVLPAVVNFAPDLIIVSAGFDAHRKDEINFQFVGIREFEFAWVTDQIVQVANLVCNGRIVSVLEGGYKIQGQIVSAFSRSVAAHVHALCEPNDEVWSSEAVAREREEDKRVREAKAQLKEKRAAARANRAAAELVGMSPCDGCEPDMVLGRMDSLLGPTNSLPEMAVDAACLHIDGPEGGIKTEPLAKADEFADVLALAEAKLPSSGSCRQSKRLRGRPVDYVALNRELDAAAASAAKSPFG